MYSHPVYALKAGAAEKRGERRRLDAEGREPSDLVGAEARYGGTQLAQELQRGVPFLANGATLTSFS